MANWVNNSLRVSGENTEYVLQALKSDEVDFDFNLVDPIPSDVRDTVAGTSVWEVFIVVKEVAGRLGLAGKAITCDDVKEHITSYDDNMLAQGVQAYNNLVKYGSTDWYAWCLAHWGTKWNACEVYNDGVNSASFDTAWSTPEALICTLSKKYPDNVFSVEYYDQDDLGFNCGTYSYKNGELTDRWTPDRDDALEWLYDMGAIDDEIYNELKD